MHYYPEDTSPDNLRKLIRDNVCAECGRQLYAYLDADGKTYIACSNQNHEGIAREYQPPIEDYRSNIRREIEMEQKVGTEVARTVGQIPKQGQLTQPQAERILNLVYPGASKDEIARTAIFCQDFGLHPLAKEVYLIKFKDEMVMIVGIAANRKMAHALKGEFSFLDDTPRAASEEEIVKQFGKDSEEAKLNVISVTKLKGEGGNLASGFGLWPTASKPYGMDKGNTQRNMANIRSERQAMDRLPGKPMPRVEVADIAYVEGVGDVDKVSGEIIEGEARELPPEPEPLPEATEPPPSTSIIDLEWLRESLKTLQAKGIKAYSDESMLSYMRVSYKGVEGDTIYEIAANLDKSKAAHLVKVIQDALDKT